MGLLKMMRALLKNLLLTLGMLGPISVPCFAQRIQPEAEELVQAANQARAQVGAGSLSWDAALAAAAREHCLRMAEEGPISHRYANEPDLTERAAGTGAHFSLIEENVAMADSPQRVHELWMNSPGHRENLLNPRVNRVGIAVVYARGQIYAVADYARAVDLLGDHEIEARIAGLLTPYGLGIRTDNHAAREYCGNDEHIHGPHPPGFLMRWTATDLTALPEQLTERIHTGRYRMAEIGSCQPQNTQGFTGYQLAVLLY